MPFRSWNDVHVETVEARGRTSLRDLYEGCLAGVPFMFPRTFPKGLPVLVALDGATKDWLTRLATRTMLETGWNNNNSNKHRVRIVNPVGSCGALL
jgi:hypothetical protein